MFAFFPPSFTSFTTSTRCIRSRLAGRLGRTRAAAVLLLAVVAAAVSIGAAMRAASAESARAGVLAPPTWPPTSDNVYGTYDIAANTSGQVWFEDKFGARVQPGLTFKVKVENPAPGSTAVPNFSVKLNGVYVATKDSLDGGAYFENPVSIQTWNAVEVWIAQGSGILRVKIESDYQPYKTLGWVERVRPATGATSTDEQWQLSLPPDAGGQHTMIIDNGNYDRTGRMACCGEVRLNGVRVFSLDTLRATQARAMIPITLQPGANTIRAIGTNMTAGAHIWVRLMYADTAKPTLIVNEPANNTVTTASSVTVSGTYQDSTYGEVRVGSASSHATLTMGTNIVLQSWSTSRSLIEGLNVIKIWATDAARNTTDTLVRTVIRDTQNPVLTVSAPAEGFVTTASSVTVSGSASDASGVAVEANGVELPLDGSGNFSGEVPLSLGANTITVVATDGAGKTASQTRNVTRNAAPTVAIDSPSEGLLTSAGAVTVSGTVAGTAPFTVSANGVSLPVDGGGNYSGSVPLEAEGENTITVTVTDGSGGTATATRTVTRDQTPPALAVTAPVEGATTTAATLQASGTVTDANGVTSLTLNGNAVTVNPDGSFSASVGLNVGPNTLTFRATDAVSNVATVTRTVTRIGTISVAVQDQNPGTSIDRSECLTIATGDDAAYECGDLRIIHELPSTRTMNRVRTPTLMYNSRHASPEALIAADVSIGSEHAPTSLEASVVIQGRPPATRTVTWDPAWSGGAARRIVVPVNASDLGLTTGAYAYALRVRALREGSEIATGSDTGTVVIVDNSASPLGAGWWLEGLERLFDVSATQKLWVGGDGSTRLYTQQQGSVWMVTPSVDGPDSLVQVGSGAETQWRRRLQNGGHVEFDNQYRHVATQNRLGHRTSFGYNGALLSTISLAVPPGSTAPVYQFSYSIEPVSRAPVLTSVDAPSLPDTARQVTLVHEGGSRRVKEITDPKPTVTAPAVWVGFKYDGTNRIIGRRNRQNDTTFFAFDEAALLGQATIDMGAGQPPIVSTFCASEGRSLSGCASGPQALDTTYTLFDGPRDNATDAADTTVFYVTRFGAPREIVNAIGHRTSIERTNASLPLLATAVVQPNGFRTEAFYNERGLLDSTKAINPLGDGRNAVTRYTWHSKWAFVTQIVRPTGETMTFDYDSDNGNRLWEQVGSDAARRVTFGYGNSMKLLSSTDSPLVPPDSVTYDALGNLFVLRTPMGFATTYTRDALGRERLVSSPIDSLQQSFRTTRTEYDVMDRPTLVVDGPGLELRTTYDVEGRPVTIARKSVPDTAKLGEIKDSLVYDAAGRKVQMVDVYRGGSGRRWTYDVAGNLVADTLANGEHTNMTYDALGRVKTRTVSTVFTAYTPGPNDVATFDYDELGNVKVADNRFARIRRSYYPNGALDTDTLRIITTDVTANDFEQHRYGLKSFYDLSGRRVALKHPAVIAVGGDSVAWRYDPETGLLASVRDVNGAEYRYSYDDALRLVRLAMPGNIVDTTLYDADSRRRLRIEVRRNGSQIDTLHREGFDLDAVGRVLGAGSKNNLSGGSFAYTVHGAVREALEAVERNRSLSIDAFGNRVSHQRETDDAPAATYTYVYAPHSTRLTGVGGRYGSTGPESAAGRDTLRQGYDPAGNMTGVEFESWVDKTPPNTVGPIWETTSFSTTVNRYAGDGRLVFSERQTSEDVDRTDHHSLERYGYKHLVSNAGLGRGVYEEYRHDALGRRVWTRAHRQRIHTYTYCDADDASRNTDCLGAVQRTVWDGDQVLFEIRQPGDDITPANHMEVDKSNLYPGRSGHFGIVGYTHGLGIDQPLAIRRDLGSSDGGLKQLTLHRDWRGMVSTSTHAVGADSGLRAECVQGQSTGCLRINWPAATHNVSRVRFMSDSGPPSWYGTLTQEHRDATGALYKRNRTYDPVTGRFTQEDPIGLAGGMNLYGFADGDPVNFSDPFGLTPCCVELSVVIRAMAGVEFAAAMARVEEMSKEAVLGSISGSRATGVVQRLIRPGSAIGKMLGKPNPVKANRAGNMQPYDAKTGQYLPNSANPGPGANPFTEFSSGVGQALIEDAGGGAIDLPPPISKAQELGQNVGRIVSVIKNIFK